MNSLKVELTVTSGPCAGKVYQFEEPQGFTFGRARDCSCVVEKDDTFSRHHFLLEVNPPHVWLRDLGSLNGTFVNGKRIGGRPAGVAPEDAEPGQTTALFDGDVIKAGVYELVLKIEVPVLCDACGREVPETEKEDALAITGPIVCSRCRQRAAEQKRAVALERKAPKPPVKEEARLSPEQRARAEENPVAVIEELLKNFLQKEGKKDGFPEIMGYRMEKKLGEGGFGAVFAATRLADGRRVAVKTMLQTRKPEPRQILMFDREKEISARLRHPHIVHCERAGSLNDIHFIEMEYMEGGCVGRLLERQGKLSLAEAKPIMLHALEGLAFAHRARIALTFADGTREITGVVHRDLKPPNLLLAGGPGRWTAKVSDFGLAKSFSEVGFTRGGITGAGLTMGSVPYMAPEHLINYRNLKPATDVFEMAATFYHMLTGTFAWNFRKNTDPYKVILQETPAPIRSREAAIPVKVAAVLDRALSRNPADRYLDAAEFLKAWGQA
jgi:eukaryotic-like serine/threonine-protein kinase